MSAAALGCLAAALTLAGRRVPRAGASPEVGVCPEAGVSPEVGKAAGSRPAARSPLLAAVGLGVAVTLVVGGPAGAVLGLAIAAGVHRGIGRLEPADARRTRERREAELPLTLDLLAVCLRAGMPLVGALEAVSDALDGPFGDDLARVAALLRLGSTPETAWAELTDDADLAAVARAASRSAESGSRLATSFERLAAERRAALVAGGEARARKAGVAAMAPLGLCFLPAFVSLGLVPIVLSLAAEVLA